MFKKSGVLILCALVLTLSSPSLFPSAAWGTDGKLWIAIDSVPKIGNGNDVNGGVWFEGTQGNYGDYAISMALEVTRGGTRWAPKPTYASPSVRINADGKFSCRFVSGGNDAVAERLFVYLVPASFTPDDDANRTESAALDMVTIDRYEDGRVVIQQHARPFERKHPARTKKLSINYSPYTNGLSPEIDSTLPMELIRRQLDVIHPFVDTIRLFRADGEPGKIYQPAKEEYKFRIIAGGWIGEGYSRQEIYRELDALIRLANNGYIDIAVVGSETMYRHDLTADALIGYINYVREGIDDKSIPVGTSDTPAAFLDNPGLVEASDVILCTIYPFFDNLPIEAAAQNMIETRNRVVNAAKDKQVIISETGWPTEGSPEGLAVPGVENAGKYFEDVYQWSRTNDAEVVFFSAFDEAWKIEGSNGDIGGHWGHFTADGKLGEAYLPVYRTISDIPDDVPEIPDDSGEKTGGGCDATGGQGVAGLSGVGLTGLFPALPRRNHKNLLKRKFF